MRQVFFMPLISGYCLGDFLEFFFGIPFSKISENMRFWCAFQIFHNLSNLPWKESSLVTCFSSSCFATPKAKDNEPALTSSFLDLFPARKVFWFHKLIIIVPFGL